MNYIKLSFFIRSSESFWNFKKKEGISFWEKLEGELNKALEKLHVTQEKKGNFLHNYFICSEDSPETFKKIAEDIIKSFFDDENEANFIAVSASLSSADEYNKQFPSAFKIPESKPVKENIAFSEGESDVFEKATNTVNTTGLAKHTEMLKSLKATLLKYVKGQRNAVEQVVQSIFECEMFASKDTKRKGPLATLLFTGPSGVGKTFLAELTAEYTGRKKLVVDMSDFAGYGSSGRFNGGGFGEDNLVTGFANDEPNGIIIFDEIEKANMSTIHLFLQILDFGRLMDHKLKKEVSFKNTIIIMTTNAGKSLYEDATVCDLSSVPRSVILDTLKTDIDPATREPFFPECIVTRMANGKVILFNHLEPFALMEIISNEVEKYINLFEISTGIKVNYDKKTLAALILYSGGGVADARSLRGLARSIVVKELQEVIMQLTYKNPEKVNALKSISITVDTDENEEVNNLFVGKERMYASIFSDKITDNIFDEKTSVNTHFEATNDIETFKKRLRGVVDYVLVDPLCGNHNVAHLPNDVEDFDSDGMFMFEYIREYFPEIPIYILDTSIDTSISFETLLARGARGIVKLDPANPEAVNNIFFDLSFSSLINNSAFSLGRSGKNLTYNCAQYITEDSEAVVSFERLKIKTAISTSDSSAIAKKEGNNGLKFADIIGCKTAKEILSEVAEKLNDPRKVAISGKPFPKGVLFYGPPGTGKTMLAKALANECNATFFPITATSFFDKYVGETERKIRDLFKKAKSYAPSIIFIDEVDAIARRRTGDSTAVHNENALNAFLAEMDGFVTDEKRPVLILAATNYDISGNSGRVLDEAFVRRFDNRIYINLPDLDDRFDLLMMYMKKHSIHFGETHEELMRVMAERMSGMNNADIDKFCSFYLNSLGEEEPDKNKFLDALDSFRYGDANDFKPEEMKQTACHEAGHALVYRLCGNTASFLTIVSRENFGGYMQHSTDAKKGSYTFEDLMNNVCLCLGGRAAEIELYGKSEGVNTGASSDIEKARKIIKSTLKDYAMGKNLSQKWDADEAEALIRQQFERTQKMISENKEILIKLTELLVEKKCLDKTQLDEFFTSQNI